MENITRLIAEKRPNWRIIVLGSSELRDNLLSLQKQKNIKFLCIKARYNDVFLSLRTIANFVTLGLFRDKITQLCFYDTICIDDKCDLFFDPYAEYAINDFNIPKISLIHDLVYLDIENFKTPAAKKWIKKCSEFILENSQKIITITNFSKERIMYWYNPKKDQVKTIYTCLSQRVNNIEVNDKFRRSILKKYGIDSKNYFIYISACWPQKNHKRLIKSFLEFLSRSKSNMKLVIVGEMSKNTLLQLKSLSDASDNIICTNSIPNDELKVLLSNSFALVFPSLYEGFGMPIIEAMAAGIPVICSNAGSIPEVAGNAAIFFNPRDTNEIIAAMQQIVTDAALRKELIKRGYQQAQKFSDTDSMINDYIKVFEDAMSAR
jgi:glycosyltransferase involved in cell wall biosynthesis